MRFEAAFLGNRIGKPLSYYNFSRGHFEKIFLRIKYEAAFFWEIA